MKIICNTREFALLVRICAESEREDGCRGCTFQAFCSTGSTIDDVYEMSCIEDLCEVRDD